jgi:glycine betaine transporter
MSEKRVPLPQFRTILFAADLSARSHEAFRVACSLASEGATRLVVVHVREEFPVVEPLVGFGEVGGVAASPGDAAARDEAIFERLRQFYAPTHPIETRYMIRDGKPADAILQAAHEVGSDLIVMGTDGRTGLDRFLLGSVAEAVLRRAHCPVATMRSSLATHLSDQRPPETPLAAQ